MQVHAGVSAIQIFDSWANILSKEDFRQFCLPFYRRMIDAVKAPVILFMRGASSYLEDLSSLPCALSLDWQIPMDEARKKTKQPLQGNIVRKWGRVPVPYALMVRQGSPEFIEGLNANGLMCA